MGDSNEELSLNVHEKSSETSSSESKPERRSGITIFIFRNNYKIISSNVKKRITDVILLQKFPF